MFKDETLINSALGKKTPYFEIYDPTLLFPILRQINRDEIQVPAPLPFTGVDVWNGYELSWLNPKGKPQIARAEIIFPCESIYIVESKSLKLYLNSFNNTPFSSMERVQQAIEKDLTDVIGSEVQVFLYTPDNQPDQSYAPFEGFCLDQLDVETNTYTLCPDFLQTSAEIVQEKLYSDLLKSNCLVTGQPDWGSLYVAYKGPKIDKEGLLKYLISFRNHNEFGEQCAERIFMDITRRCKPQKLTVYARYTRRGGLDINPFRTNCGEKPENSRQFRQ